MADLKQFVNLPADPKLLGLDSDITAKERLGRELHFKCKFKNGKLANFKVKVIPQGSQAKYTKKELARNGHFRLREKIAKPKPKGEKVKLAIDYSLPAAGGNKYKVSASYKGKVVESGKTIKTWRRIYYQSINMTGISVPGIGSVESDYTKHFIDLTPKGGAGTMTYKKNVRSEDYTNGRVALIKSAKPGYQIKDYEPNAVALLWVEMIAGRQLVEFDITDSPEIKVKSKLLSWGGATITYTLPSDRYLWWDLDATDDAQNGGRGVWLIQNSCNFIDAAGTPHRIPDLNITIDLTQRLGSLGGYNTLKMVMPPGVQNLLTSKKGRIEIKLRCVAGFSNGYEDPIANIVVVANSAFFDPRKPARRVQTLVHELGHKIGMVAEGVDRDPDPPGSLYGGFRHGSGVDQQGHQGPHCSTGMTYDGSLPPAQAWSGTPGCVMFGSGWEQRPSTYCGTCEPVVRKLDLEGKGHRSLDKSLTTY